MIRATLDLRYSEINGYVNVCNFRNSYKCYKSVIQQNNYLEKKNVIKKIIIHFSIKQVGN